MEQVRRPFGVIVFAAAAIVALELPSAPAAAIIRRADAAAIYAEHCAGCHGKEGHGDGALAKDLKYKPRDFREGKFAFGNTADAMVKTIMSGIPGEEQARMPAFKSVLAVADIEAVVALVRTMMPAEVAPTPADMKMEPRDGPIFVRGLIAPFKEGDPPIPRGLLLGLPSGFTFEYATDNVRLLAVRRGEFATRSDWEGRGGKPLTPLGAVLFAPLQPLEWAAFVVRDSTGEGKLASVRPTAAKLRATSTAGGVAELSYNLLDTDGRVRASVRERPREAVVSGGAGLMQELEFTAPVATTLGFSVAIASAPELPLPQPKSDKPAAGADAIAKHAAEQKLLAQASGWWVVRGADLTIAVRYDLPENGRADQWSGPGRDALNAWVTTGKEPVRLRRTIVVRAAVTLDELAAMAKELGR